MSIDVFPSLTLATLQNPLPLTQGGTGATTAATARTNLGLGTMSEQNASAVAITGGSATLNTVATGYLAMNWAGNPPHGVYIDDAPAGAHNGLVGLVSAGANRMNLNIIGTAPNYFGGTVQVVGTVGIQRAPWAIAACAIQWAKASQNGLSMQPSDSDSGSAPITFLNLAGTGVGTINTNASSTSYNTTSDVRLKHAIATLTDALERVRALRPVSFKWNADDSKGVGFLAHELQQTIPEAVTGQPDEVNDDGSIRAQGVDHSKLVPWLTSAVQALLARVETLEAQVAALQA
jgi:Chaperone of endosialidase